MIDAPLRPEDPVVPVDLDAGLPAGFGVALDLDTKIIGRSTLWGGSPARALRLSAAGVRAFEELSAGPVLSRNSARLGRRLIDAGLAHPRAAAWSGPLDVTVIIPVRDRSSELGRCLAALGHDNPVLVVDDGSSDPDAVAEVCRSYGARLVRRPTNGGPAAARNTGLQAVRTELVAFLDSDVVAPPGWLRTLAAHLSDPLVAGAAPRIAADAEGGSARARYLRARSPLDLGDREAMVAPMTRVSYLPTAALLVRRTAVEGGFDEGLRYGEDVDLIWRLVANGWRLRYDPSVQVAHREPVRWQALRARRYAYGTSAAPLARRHPGALAPLVLQPWPTLTVSALLARRPRLAVVTWAIGTACLTRRLRTAGLPVSGLLRPTLSAVRYTWLGAGRWGDQFAAPLLVAVMLRPGGDTRRTRWGRRVALASLLMGPPLTEWASSRRALDPVRFSMAMLADDVAYGAGVWRGCAREREFSPLLPWLSWNPLDAARSRLRRQ